MVQHLHDAVDSSGFWIVCAINEPLETRVGNGSGAHGTGFQGDKEFATDKTMIADRASGFAHGDDLGVRRGVVIKQIAIGTASDYLSVVYDHRADRDFPAGFGALRFTKSLFHPDFVGDIHLFRPL